MDKTTMFQKVVLIWSSDRQARQKPKLLGPLIKLVSNLDSNNINPLKMKGNHMYQLH
jgi:hypothetical protein